MSESERNKVIAYLERLDASRRRRILSTLDSFVEWMEDVLTWVFIKVRRVIRDFFRSLQELFGSA